MPKSVFDWRQQPYYLILMVFDALAAITSLINNTMTVGTESDFYMILTALYTGLVAWSAAYLFHCSKGGDEDADMKMADLPLGKHWYYIATIVGCTYRGYAGYEMNHNGTGLESVYGMMWVLSAPFLWAYTWANYKSYVARTGKGEIFAHKPPTKSV